MTAATVLLSDDEPVSASDFEADDRNETDIARVLDQLLTRAGNGPADRRSRRVAARTEVAAASSPRSPQPEPELVPDNAEEDLAMVIPFGLRFNGFEASLNLCALGPPDQKIPGQRVSNGSASGDGHTMALCPLSRALGRAGQGSFDSIGAPKARLPHRQDWNMSRDIRLRATFDRAAASYQDARPDYPDELYSDLLAITGVTPPAHLLEVGCGPGKATLPLAREGFRITAVELGDALAREARHRLTGFSDVSVVTSSFEGWQPPAGAHFDLLYAATAWKWVDPEVKYAKAAALLAQDGHLAVWNADHAMPTDFDPIFTEIQKVYEEIGEGHDGPWPPPPPEDQPDPMAAEFEASGHFTVVATKLYVWSLRYTADAYIALLNTFSGHIAMEPAKIEHLYREIRRHLAARPDGRLTRHWSAALTIGRRL
ncbi:Methyltransferase domain-containing protein [Nonomuraea maritima]|uniref:Methyltransferase domain-containing protein n=1 Tax=Nonomuraea maritima TaxID=683260 RepID=A0A1G9LLX9_9ACTN|nr:class I SAM-dependent methyltransferase [Nonomuraea maritima]SDL62908.1 Methyltransferase domain-containing protein [Nonomuraea maritima]